MYLTKLMNKNSQQVKPEPEQPEFSKEEYAAMKKAEREQLWERIDTLTADVLKDAESLHGFLDFAARSESRTFCCSTPTLRKRHG